MRRAAVFVRLRVVSNASARDHAACAAPTASSC